MPADLIAWLQLKRMHYHDFMLDVHKRLQGQKSADPLLQVRQPQHVPPASSCGGRVTRTYQRLGMYTRCPPWTDQAQCHRDGVTGGMCSAAMTCAQQRAWQWQWQLMSACSQEQSKSAAEAAAQVAGAIMEKVKVLCLDEVFVTDVADAAIMNRLFGHMWDQGLVLVSTSNRCCPPRHDLCLGTICFAPA